MSDPIEIHRKEVAQRILLAKSQGGWEGTHTDFKRELGSTHRDLAKLVKHILAFANTPRRTDAYIIFGVNEDKLHRTFDHVGTDQQSFPSPERIYSLVHEYTTLKDVVVDALYVLNAKPTPYIAIPLQYEGPYKLSRPMQAAEKTVEAGVPFCRYGSSSVRATERDVRHMNEDWAKWFLDCRYEKNATSLHESLSKRFPKCTLVDLDKYVRLVYQSAVTDELGLAIVPVLVHAYWGYDPVEEDAVERINGDRSQSAYHRTIVAARFSMGTREAAAAATVRCVPLDEIYFVNDHYAQFCREFLRAWNEELSESYGGVVIDLDYIHSAPSKSVGLREESILSFVEGQLRAHGRIAALVHGAFGCGKTTIAKQLVAHLCEDYLRGHSDALKVIYVNANNIDIRSKRDECIESELTRYRLSRDQIDALVTQVRDDKIQLVFDGVDEMARPYTAEGRRQGVQLLREIGNRRAAAYFVRSSYYPQLEQMMTDFAPLAASDLSTGEKRIVAVEVQSLRKEQIDSYLTARLGSDDAGQVRSGLHKIGLASFLSDPLIVSLVTKFVEERGTNTFGSFPRRGQKSHYLSHLVEQLLEREQYKRQRHTALFAENFSVFQKVLRTVAFKMVCNGLSTVLPSQLNAFVDAVLGDSDKTSEGVDAFRTMSWIQRSGDGSLAFRHEALTVLCAAQHVRAALEEGDSLAVADWQQAAPLAGDVCVYAGDLATCKTLLSAAAMLGNEVQFNVRELVTAVLETAQGRDVPGGMPQDWPDEAALASVCRFVLSMPYIAITPLELLFRVLGAKRAIHVQIPLLWLLSQNDSVAATEVAAVILRRLPGRERHFCEDLAKIKENQSASVDSILLRQLRISEGALADSSNYRAVFDRIQQLPGVDGGVRQYAVKSLAAIEGEQNRRAKAFSKEVPQRPASGVSKARKR